MQEIITSDDILGKDVVDTDGEIIGVVQQLKIDKRYKKILGVLVDQGFMKPDLYVGLDLIRNFGVDSIFLKKSPKPKIKGLDVYDKVGKKVGFVYNIEEINNELLSIIVKRHYFGKSFKIKSNDIKTIGYSIILKKQERDIYLEGVK